MIGLGPRCFYCKHYNHQPLCSCAAFPEGIPSRIFLSREEHLTPYEGDHGIQFELDPNLSQELVGVYQRRYGVQTPAKH